MAKIVSLSHKSKDKTKVVCDKFLQGTRIIATGTPNPGVTTIFVQSYDFGKEIDPDNYRQHAQIVDGCVLTLINADANIQDIKIEEYNLTDEENGI